MKKKILSIPEKTDVSRRKALARIGLAITVAYVIPVVMTISRAEAGDGSGYHGGSKGGSGYRGDNMSGYGYYEDNRGGSGYRRDNRGGSGFYGGGSRGGSGWFWW